MMKHFARRELLKMAGFGAAGTALCSLSGKNGFSVLEGIQGRPDRQPNILFILCDDLGINDLHCYGRQDHHTPNLDRLAAQGMRFTSAYCAQPICSASRAALLTGKNPARLHLTTYLPGRPDCISQKLLHPNATGVAA